MESNPKKRIDSYLALANGLRFKLWAIVGKDETKKQNIVSYLTNTLKWVIIDVESQLSGIYKELDQLEEPSSEVGLKIKEWFNSLPNNIILTNASILYHTSFTKISPVGAFKYNSRNKNCVIFLEDEELLGNRLYYGEAGDEDYYDREINDIVKTKLNEIQDDYTPSALNKGATNYEVKITNKDAIGKLFDFHEIKDVLDLDYFNNQPNIFTDECIWQSVKAFRNGFVVFSKKGENNSTIPEADYVINFISPYSKNEEKKSGKNQLDIHLEIPGLQNVEHLKRIAAIRSLLRKNVLTSIMGKKLSDEIESKRW